MAGRQALRWDHQSCRFILPRRLCAAQIGHRIKEAEARRSPGLLYPQMQGNCRRGRSYNMYCRIFENKELPPMPIVVAGATGNVGRPTVSALIAQGHSVRALSRSEEKFAALPQGASGAIADLETGAGLDAAFDGIDQLFLITANGETETARGLNAVSAARTSGVRRIVFLSVQGPDQEPPIPHSRSKLPIEQAIRESGCEYTILRPGYFNQTDLSVVQVVREYGIYPMPIGSIGTNRVDTRDIADCAVRALTEDGHAGAEYELCGPDTISGPGAAAVYARYFGREVRYGGDDVEKWAEPIKAFIAPWLLESLKKMLLSMQRNGPAADAAAVAASEEAVGHPLRTFDAFVAELAATAREA
ncbi:MAG: NAD(P)H-binding protein [Gammaproteobacteria bacterium]|nr:NAD(P)H-binding protein [Gammaproteobacteria bacterium]